MANTDELARRLREAGEKRAPIPPIRGELPEGDLDAAYAVQNVNTQHWIRQRRRPVGRKIGLTAKTVQKQLGVDQPDFGVLYADMTLGDLEEIAADRVL